MDQTLEDSLAGPIVRDHVVEAVALRGGVFRMAADVKVEASTVLEKHIGRPTPTDDTPEQIAGHFVGR